MRTLLKVFAGLVVVVILLGAAAWLMTSKKADEAPSDFEMVDVPYGEPAPEDPQSAAAEAAAMAPDQMDVEAEARKKGERAKPDD